MEQERLENARAFCQEVKELAQKRNLPFFVVTEGASAISNKDCEAVRNARMKHIEWEISKGLNPLEDWNEDR